MKFNLPLPPPLNSIYRFVHHRMYKTRKARDWEMEAGWLIKSQKKIRKPITTDVEVFMTLRLKRDRDIDSAQKLLFDLLEKTKVIENDRQITVMHVFKEKGNGTMEVIVDRIEDDR